VCRAFCPVPPTATPGTAASAGATAAADPTTVAATATQGANAAADPTTFPFTIIVIILQTVNDNGVVKLTMTITCTGAGTLTADNEAYLHNLVVEQMAASLNVDPSQVTVVLKFVSSAKRSISTGTTNTYSGNAAIIDPNSGSSGFIFGSSFVMVALSVFLSYWIRK